MQDWEYSKRKIQRAWLLDWGQHERLLEAFCSLLPMNVGVGVGVVEAWLTTCMLTIRRLREEVKCSEKKKYSPRKSHRLRFEALTSQVYMMNVNAHDFNLRNGNSVTWPITIFGQRVSWSLIISHVYCLLHNLYSKIGLCNSVSSKLRLDCISLKMERKLHDKMSLSACL